MTDTERCLGNSELGRFVGVSAQTCFLVVTFCSDPSKLMFDCAQDVGGSGAARRRRDRRLRCIGDTNIYPFVCCVRLWNITAGRPGRHLESRLMMICLPPLIEYVLDDTFAAPAPLMKHVSSAPDDTYIAPASTRVNCDIRCLVNPQFFFLLWRPLFLPWTIPLRPFTSKSISRSTELSS